MMKGFWCDEYKFKWCNYQEGTESGIGLSDSIDF